MTVASCLLDCLLLEPAGVAESSLQCSPAVETARALRSHSRSAGVSDFSDADNITLRPTDCAQPELPFASSTLTGTHYHRNYSLIPLVPAPVVVVCLARGARPIVQIGSAFEVSDLGYTLSHAEIAAGISFTASVYGVGDFGAADVVQLMCGACPCMCARVHATA